ncbi:hypothetical protein GOA67_09105, partial [Sinorhizobium meliloti]|nr:hypothetical protein [Sinorhizobium meliloti]
MARSAAVQKCLVLKWRSRPRKTTSPDSKRSAARIEGRSIAEIRPGADSDEAAPLFRDDCAPGFRDDLAPC